MSDFKKSFSHPLSRQYWKLAAKDARTLKILVLVSVLIALRVTLSAFFITVGDNLRIYFTFFISAAEAAIAGPVMAIISGFLTDTISYLITPAGAYFPGYMLSTMLGSVIYALFLYRTKITIVKLVSAKLLINVFINVGLGSLWSCMLYGKAFYYYFAKSVVKNVLLFPIEAVLLVIFFAMIVPFLSKRNLIPSQPKKIPWF